MTDQEALQKLRRHGLGDTAIGHMVGRHRTKVHAVRTGRASGFIGEASEIVRNAASRLRKKEKA